MSSGVAAMIKKMFRYYARYVLWVIIIAAFSYAFEIIYSSNAKDFLLTAFIAASLAAVMYATK